MSDWQPLVDCCEQMLKALLDFMEEIRPKATVFGVPVAPFRPFPVRNKVQEVPEAFRRR